VKTCRRSAVRKESFVRRVPEGVRGWSPQTFRPDTVWRYQSTTTGNPRPTRAQRITPLGGVSRRYEQCRRNYYSTVCIRLPGGHTGSVIFPCSFDMSLTRKGTRTCNIYSRGKTNAGIAQVENTCTCQTDFLRVTPAEVAKSSELQCKQMTDEPDGKLAYSLCDYSCPRRLATPCVQ
jgi:hypothetical protein